MTAVVLLRHGPTAWNRDGLLQGHRDIPLSPDGRAEVATWRIPDAYAGFAWVSSPLSRAMETARMLGAPVRDDGDPAWRVDARFREISWGVLEGRPRREAKSLLRRDGREMDAPGLDFRVEGGESWGDLRGRLRAALADIAASEVDSLVVCHRGVIRACLAMAFGWDMRGPPPHDPAHACAQHFTLDASGAPTVADLDVPLAREDDDAA